MEKMIGFLLSLGSFAFEQYSSNDNKVISYKDFRCQYMPDHKFREDKLFFETDDRILLLDGVIYNKLELMSIYKKSTWEETYIQLSREKDFLNKLRGNFCGCIYYKKTGELICFTDPMAASEIKYCKTSRGLIVATNIDLIKSVLDINRITYTLDVEGLYALLEVGCIHEDRTPIREIKKLRGGDLLIYSNPKKVVNITKYFQFENLPVLELSEDEAIEEFDKRFKKAIKRIVDKNEEYGYKYIVADMSGGLDTRVVNFAIKEVGYKNVINVNYCNRQGIDLKIARQISNDLNNPLIYYDMENGDFLKDIDELIKIYEGSCRFYISTGAFRAYAKIPNIEEIGMAVTGLGGSEIVDALCVQGESHSPAKLTEARIISLELNREYEVDRIYKNYEECNLYNYAMGQILKSGQTRRKYLEFSSPFFDKDFLEFALKLPIKWRKNAYFKCRWIEKKYPEATKYIWQQTGKNLDGTRPFFGIGSELEKNTKRLVNKLCTLFHLNFRMYYSTNMNPFNYWYINNKSLRHFMNTYYDENIDLVENTELRNILQKVWNAENVKQNKLSVLNVLGVIKRYISSYNK